MPWDRRRARRACAHTGADGALPGGWLFCFGPSGTTLQQTAPANPDQMAATGQIRSQHRAKGHDVLPAHIPNLHCIKIRRSHRGAVASQARAASRASATPARASQHCKSSRSETARSCCRGARVAGASFGGAHRKFQDCSFKNRAQEIEIMGALAPIGIFNGSSGALTAASAAYDAACSPAPAGHARRRQRGGTLPAQARGQRGHAAGTP